mgnify:CR=1 FL=1
MHSNRYTLIYATVLSVITAIVLAVAAEGLKPAQEANIALDKKSNILRAVRLAYTERAQIEDTYSKSIQEIVLDATGKPLSGITTKEIDLKEEMAKAPQQRRLPLYVFTEKDGKKYWCAISNIDRFIFD